VTTTHHNSQSDPNQKHLLTKTGNRKRPGAPGLKAQTPETIPEAIPEAGAEKERSQNYRNPLMTVALAKNLMADP
jgi:hypothetical protein